MPDLLDRLAAGDVLIGDGAMGTFLQNRGLASGECPELWNETHPEVVAEIARAYLEAGSDIVETNSFGANRFKLEHFGLDDKVVGLNRLATQIAKKEAGDNRFVAASVGPTGQFLEPYGTISPDEMTEVFRQQVQALAAGGADAICIETFTDLGEASAAVTAAREATELPIICTFTFDKQKDGSYKTMMGVDPAQFASQIGADIVGSNCGNGIENMIEIARILRQATDKPVMVQANAGMPVLEDGKTVFKATPEDMARHIPTLLDIGVNIIGGCCGTTPEHIKAFAEAVRR